MKKPSIFKPDIGYINNNKKTYCSFIEELPTEERKHADINSFLDNISRNGEYVFNKRVTIVTKDKTYHTKIAGKMGNRIVTIDGNSINTENIIDIFEQ